jgi:hypothetical protein
MKKTTIKILLIAFILSAGLGLDAKVTINKIEYFPGEDFVQLHMQTDKILPIPDIFYPEKDNLSRLVMRIKDVEFKVDSNALSFDSPVIRDLTIKNSPDYSDVEIMLKGEVNYRVFTNQTGLYIEFPVLKGLAAISSDRKVTTPAPPVAKADPVTVPPAAAADDHGRVSVRDVRVASQQPGRISFELALSRQTEYHRREPGTPGHRPEERPVEEDQQGGEPEECQDRPWRQQYQRRVPHRLRSRLPETLRGQGQGQPASGGVLR